MAPLPAQRHCAPSAEVRACPPGSILFDAEGNEYVVVRRLYGSYYLLIPKYTPARSGRLDRLIGAYSAGEVIKAARSIGGITRYVANYGLDVPAADIEAGFWLCCPSIGPHVATLLSILPSLYEIEGLGTCIGVTGSLLAGHWRENLSDVDIVVDIGSPQCWEASERLRETIRPLPVALLHEWLRREAEARKIGIDILKGLVTHWQRGIIDGYVVSIAPLSFEKRVQAERRFFFTQPQFRRKTFCIDEEPLEIGDYPALVPAREGCIIVYDGIFVPPLLEGGCFEAWGPLVDVVGENGLHLRGCIGVGGREGGFIRRLS